MINAVPKPKRRGKKSERTKVVEALDKAFGDFIKQRDNYTCVVCGTKNNPTCGHLYSRSNHSTRWDEENCYCQCGGCNMRHEYEFEPFRRIVEARLGKKKLEALWFRHNQTSNFKLYELRELTEHYRSLIK